MVTSKQLIVCENSGLVRILSLGRTRSLASSKAGTRER
jgi:hypothetical protein